MKSLKKEKKSVVEKRNVDEKKKEIIYCICIVLVLLFLAFGDQIAMHFITQMPNPNNTVWGGEEISAEDYKIDFLTELKIPEILEKIENQEDFVLLSSRDSCHTCEKYIPLLKQEFDKYNVTAYYMNRSLYDLDNAYYVEFMNVDTRLQKNLQYTPYLMCFKNGKLVDEIVGRKSVDVVEDFIKRNQLENNKI